MDVPIPQLRRGNVIMQIAASHVSAGPERNLVSFAEKNLVWQIPVPSGFWSNVIDKAGAKVC